jgi:hypothetical protein
MKDFGGPKISQWERRDPKRIQRRLRITQNSQKQLKKLRMASTDREREKNSKSSKLSEIGIIVKNASQAFQRRKRLVKRSYRSKDICGQSFGQPSPVSRDESASVLLTSTSV